MTWYLRISFFFKQKTAYEWRISDWSSDVCSSDLADAGAAAGHQRQLSVQSPAVRGHCGLPFRVGRSIAPRPIEDAAMPRSLATSTMIPGALLLALACAACNRPPPPPPDQPPEPQANTHLRESDSAPIDRAKQGEGAVQDAAEKQKAAIDAAAGG